MAKQNQGIAKVFKFGQSHDIIEVALPAYTAEVYPTGTNTHQLEDGEVYGVGSSGSFSIEEGYRK